MDENLNRLNGEGDPGKLVGSWGTKKRTGISQRTRENIQIGELYRALFSYFSLFWTWS